MPLSRGRRVRCSCHACNAQRSIPCGYLTHVYSTCEGPHLNSRTSTSTVTAQDEPIEIRSPSYGGHTALAKILCSSAIVAQNSANPSRGLLRPDSRPRPLGGKTGHREARRTRRFGGKTVWEEKRIPNNAGRLYIYPYFDTQTHTTHAHVRMRV